MAPRTSRSRFAPADRRAKETKLQCELLEERIAPALGGIPATSNLNLFAVDPTQYASNDIIVRFQPGVTAAQLAAVQAEQGTEITDDFSVVAGLHVVHLGAGISVETALAAYRSSPLIAYAEPDYRVHLQLMPNDPQFSSQWDLSNTGQNGGIPGVDIQAQAAWNLTTGSGNTVVAVIDTGVDYTHPDLAANTWTNPGEIAGNGIDDDHNGYVDDIHGYDFANRDGDPIDDHNHGTHVAGTIGAVGNNGIGITGINWRVQIMALKILDANGSGSSSDAIRALNYAVANGASISNNSYGGDPYSQALRDAIANAAAAGHIFVAAAGNGNWLGIGQDNDQEPFYPANYALPNVVAVGATDSSDRLAVFSNYGANTVDLAAPGVGILSTTRNNTYSVFDGTSMAAPHVTGALALVRDLHPDWSYQQVISQILNTVDVIPALQGKTVTGGRLNLARAVLPPPVIDLNWTGGSLTGPVTADWQVPFSVSRTYNITGEAAQSDFTISYYASANTSLGDSDDVLLGTETISAAADKDMGTHSGSSPGLQIVTGGSYYLFAKVDSGGGVYETNELNNTVMASNPVLVTGPVLLDNSQAAYSETGSGWINWISGGYGGSLRYHAAGTGANTASWQVNGLALGYYVIQATWNGDRSHATNAPLSIYDGNTLLQTVQVNQVNAPVGTTLGGVTFQNIATVQLTNGNLRVVLSDNANANVVADAIRIVPIPPPVIDLNWSDGGITTPATADSQTPFTVNRTYTIAGEAASVNFAISYYRSTDAVFGNADDVLLATESVSAAGDKTVGTHSGTSPNLQITTGGTYHLFGRVDGNNNVVEADEANNVTQAAQAIVVAVPIMLDNGQAGYSETGSGWLSWSAGYGGNLRYHAAGSGANTAVWQGSGLNSGYYQVQATWTADPNHATNAPYSFYDGTTLLQTVTVNQRPAPTGAVVGGYAFQNLGIAKITGSMLRIVLGDNANGYVVADAIRLIPLVPPTVDLNWVGGGVTVPASADWQSAFNVSRTYTISGTPALADFAIAYYSSADSTFGNADDVLLATETILSAADKAVGSHSGTSPALQIATGGTYYVFAKLDSGSAILETEEANNVVQSGQALPVSGPVIVDNGAAGYSESGTGWLGWSAGYAGTLRYHAAGTGANKATWQASGLVAGYYQVQATWNADPNHANNAPFSIYDGNTLLQTVAVNQKPAPSGSSFGGVPFQTLATVWLNGSTLKVVLADNANGYVVADAVRLVPLPMPTIDLNWADGGISGPTSSDWQSSFSMTRTYTIAGTPAVADFAISYYASRDAIFGNSDDVVLASETITATADKTVGSHAGASPALQMTAGGTFYLFAKVDSGSAVLEIDEANNVAQTAQTIIVSGPMIVDNSDPGYGESGSGWLGWNAGYNGNLRYHAKATGANTATWQAVGIVPGYYLVQSTWNADPNHATNAPYSFYDGATLLQTVAVNQRPAPTGDLIGGVRFQTLATVRITSSSASVVLTDNANGFVVADAIRLVPTSGGASMRITGGTGGQSGTGSKLISLDAAVLDSQVPGVEASPSAGRFQVAGSSGTPTPYGVRPSGGRGSMPVDFSFPQMGKPSSSTLTVPEHAGIWESPLRMGTPLLFDDIDPLSSETDMVR